MTTEITRIINGFKQFSENPYLDSINFLKEYIEVEPSSEAFFELGKALFFNDDYDESVKYLKMTDDFRSDAYLGLNHFKMKDYQKAIIHFEEFSKENTNETILKYLMISYEKGSDWRNAIKTGERLLDMNRDNFSIMLRLVDYHFNLKEYQNSLDYIDELTADNKGIIDYESVELMYYLRINKKKLIYKKGLVLFKLKRYGESIGELKGIKCIEAYRLISNAYEKLDKPTKAIRYLWKIYEQNPDNDILFEISEIYFKNRSHQYSIHTLERILSIDKNNEKALEGIVKNYFKLQKFDLTITYCEELLKINKNNFTACLYLSDIYPFLENFEKSMEYVERGLAINPKSSKLWIKKAWNYYNMDFEKFKKTYEVALRLEPNNMDNYILLIDVCGWEDDRKSAQKFYKRLLFYNPTCTVSFDEIFNK